MLSKNKERLQKKLLKNIKNFLNKRKTRKIQYGYDQYKNLLEDEKQNQVEYREIYSEIWKNENASHIKKLTDVLVSTLISLLK